MTPFNPHALEFSRFAGEMAESLSFNKSIGQIYGLLFLHPQPLSLSDIAQALSMSKGNASINLRFLESWGAVRLVSMHGSRGDHYEANTNLQELLITRLREGFGRRLKLADERLDSLMTRVEDHSFKKKLGQFKDAVLKAKTGMESLEKVMKFMGRL